jgi:hypothetical protein
MENISKEMELIAKKSVHQHCVLIRRSVSVMELVVGNVCVLKDIREERRFAKTSMNARETTPVMLMQTVLTPKVRTTAPVKMATKEMEEIAQISTNVLLMQRTNVM